MADDGDIVLGLRGSKEYRYIKDVRGSVTNILDNTGAVVLSYTYDAYGNTEASNQSFKNSFAYTGAIIDPESGLYYMNARYYDPATGRFISQDSYRGGGDSFWHLYGYCDGDPVNSTDKEGNKQGSLFTSPLSAIKDFAQNYYNMSLYVRMEFGCLMYTTKKNKKTYYSYTNYVIGKAHSASPGLCKKFLKKGQSIYAFIHTHTNSNSFSEADKKFAASTNVPLYVLIPNKSIKLYKSLPKKYPLKVTDATCAKNIKLNSLNTLEKRMLKNLTQRLWTNHIKNEKCDFNCKKKEWPAW